MTEKNYHIGHGINACAKNGEGVDCKQDVKEFCYSENLLDFFDKNKVNLMYKFLQTNYVKEFINAVISKEYQDYAKLFEDKNEDDILMDEASKAKRLEKILDLMGEKYKNETEEFVDKLKQENKQNIEFIQNIYKEAQNSKVNNELKIENNKAVLNGEFLFHNVSYDDNIEEYESRQHFGIIASEYFGRAESMLEGAFCSFFEKQKDIEPKKDDATQGTFKEPAAPYFSLIFDLSSESGQKLLENDFFDYIRNKDKRNYIKAIPEEKLNAFKFIETYSPSSKIAATSHPDWVAIPSGVPSKYIVGIMSHNIKKDSPEETMAREVSELFNVPLINSELNVVHNPKNVHNKIEIKPKERTL